MKIDRDAVLLAKKLARGFISFSGIVIFANVLIILLVRIIRRFILESKRCEIECKKQFNTSVNDLRKEYDSKLNAYKGTSKDSLAKKDIEIIKFKFRQNLRELETQYQAKLIECKKLLYLNIESNLNEKQLILWNIWKATGKIPCEIKP